MSSRPHWTGSRLLGAALLLLALWVQTLAPALALHWDLASAGPTLDLTICGHTLAPGDDVSGVATPQPSMPGCSHCGLCSAGVATPTLPSLPVIARTLRWLVVSWPMPPPARGHAISKTLPQARGPPSLA
ncbi:DUF2946 family protein [Methylobacterium sp. C25]|uniref:DUF2946 family protein n=1 Tax=Methylobacterium sp. C25 TaxID=2721622 RepID=UPI001F17E1C8|nr:DUF2946 family protein [Methylobacterium sp. C25]MCE4226723.1 DUF2946 family protein [Methylobacterium sp. C25]